MGTTAGGPELTAGHGQVFTSAVRPPVTVPSGASRTPHEGIFLGSQNYAVPVRAAVADPHRGPSGVEHRKLGER